MTANPYAPPRADGAGDAPQKSFARRTSFVLAAAGFVLFWGTMVLVVAGDDQGQPAGAKEALLGWLALVAITMHLVGIGIVFAAPRGRRLLPALLNAVSLLIMVGLMVPGLVAAAGVQ